AQNSAGTAKGAVNYFTTTSAEHQSIPASAALAGTITGPLTTTGSAHLVAGEIHATVSHQTGLVLGGVVPTGAKAAGSGAAPVPNAPQASSTEATISNRPKHGTQLKK
ncbi:MAG: hypothetical protein WCE75_15775, partial [Terracidiphilus sp.]